MCDTKGPLLRGTAQRQPSQEVQGHLGIAFWSLTRWGGLLHTATGLQLLKGASLEELINLQSCTPLIMRVPVMNHRGNGRQIQSLCMQSCAGVTRDRPFLSCQGAELWSTRKGMTHLGNGAFAYTLHMADLLSGSDFLRIRVDDICNLFECYSLKAVICRTSDSSNLRQLI